MKICRKLSTGEILVLFAAFRIAKKGYKKSEKGRVDHAGLWVNNIAKESGLKYNDLVESHEKMLEERGFLSKRQFGDRSGVNLGDYYRLTDLGRDICEYINKYDETKN